MSVNKICIVTSNYISGTPRVVKEADALLQAGYDVRVVFSQGNIELNRLYDKNLLADKSWSYSSFGWSSSRDQEKRLYHFSGIRHFIARNLPRTISKFRRIAETGHGRVYPELARLAASEPADFYIGHYPDGLAAAAYAASRWRALLAYDFEDFHVGEGKNIKVQQRVEIIEQRYLPRCMYLTAASPLMADALSKHYSIKRPIPIHNVFPWADRETLDGKIKDRRGDALSIYWYSQTIGLDRGIQDAIQAAGLIDAPIQIHLRGALSEEVKQALLALAAECGLADRLYFHERVSPTELLSRAVEHDIGLAAEQPVDTSRQISVTNKLFFYLLAGLCVAATDVPGQRRLMDTIPDAGFLYPVGDHDALALQLKKFIDQPELLTRYKLGALHAAQTTWNWEKESQKLVEAVTTSLSKSSNKRSSR